MKRLLMLIVAVVLAGLIVAWATELRQDTAVDPAMENLGAFLAQLDGTPTPEGRLSTAQPVPFPASAGTLVAHDTFFPLSGGHDLDCMACHTAGDYRGTLAACIDCHAAAEPHEGDYGTECAICHDLSAWSSVRFDHAFVDTDCAACHAPPANHYPGACAACHISTENFQVVNFDHSAFVGTDCAACHAPPANHYPGACSTCHQDTGNFRNATFNHTFPINHEGANGDCAACHPGGNTATYTCTACHNQQEMVEEHVEEGVVDIGNCVACHADGREPDDD